MAKIAFFFREGKHNWLRKIKIKTKQERKQKHETYEQKLHDWLRIELIWFVKHTTGP